MKRCGVRPFRFALVWLAVGLFFVGDAHALSPTLFGDDAVLEASLTGPISALLANTEDRSARPFIFRVEGLDHQFNIEAHLHGHSRLKVCGFPPLLLHFPSEPGQPGLAQASSLRLVTHCRNHARGEQDMLEEFMAHRILNLLTDFSYRVRLLHITYHDTEARSRDSVFTRYAFVLEPHENLAARTGARRVNLGGLPKHRHDLENAAVVYIFQYLIANTDWGLVKADLEEYCCHNSILFERDSTILFVPFDFDLSGLVNAGYAFPDGSLRIKRVTQRTYRGVCTERGVLRAALRKVKAARTGILSLPQRIPGLSPENIARDTRFLNAFFEKAEDEDKLLRYFERRCIE